MIKGRVLGIYTDWATCAKQTQHFKGNLYQSFTNKIDAETYFNSYGSITRDIAASKAQAHKKTSNAHAKTCHCTSTITSTYRTAQLPTEDFALDCHGIPLRLGNTVMILNGGKWDVKGMCGTITKLGEGIGEKRILTININNCPKQNRIGKQYEEQKINY